MMVDKDGCGDIFFDEFVLWFCIEKGFKNIDRDEFKLLFEKFKLGNCNDL